MNATEYIENATVTESRDFDAIRARLTDRNIRLLHAAIGVATEAGELLDAMKKSLFYGKPLDEVNYREEGGDILWYLAIAFDELRTTFEQEMGINIDKLKARYGDKFSAARALKRDLKTERSILEGTGILSALRGELGESNCTCGYDPRCNERDHDMACPVHNKR